MLNSAEDTLFLLLRVAIGAECADGAVKKFPVEGVSWSKVYEIARKQGVLAIAFDGLVKIFERDEEFARTFPLPLKLQWINATLTIEKRYNHSRDISAELADKWAEQGIKTACLKGMAFSRYYPVPEHRECGDFDCYLFDDYAKGNSIARAIGARVEDDFYKHSEIIYKKLMVENHQYIVATRTSKKVRAFNAMLVSLLHHKESSSYIQSTKILMPSAMFNALFMTHHSHSHFLSEGIRLRHILDWVLFLRAEQHNLDWKQFYTICDQQGLRAFVDVQTAIAKRVFGIEIECEEVVANSPYTERVLESIMRDDTAIFSQNVGKWRTRMMLLQNLFALRWKYKAFSDRGVVMTFVSLVYGFLFHTEE